MRGRIRCNLYSQDLVLVEKGEMDAEEIHVLLRENERKARDLLKCGWDHVVYGMKKYDHNGVWKSTDFMLMPMTEEQFSFIATRCRNALVYALHKR